MEFHYIAASGLESFCDIRTGIMKSQGSPVAMIIDRPDNPGTPATHAIETVATLLYHRTFRDLGYSMREINWYVLGDIGLSRVVLENDLGRYYNPTWLVYQTEPIIEEFK